MVFWSMVSSQSSCRAVIFLLPLRVERVDTYLCHSPGVYVALTAIVAIVAPGSIEEAPLGHISYFEWNTEGG